MKKILKVSTLLCLLMMLLGLTACSNPASSGGSSSGSSKEVVAVYKGITDKRKHPYEVTVTCYSDKTFVVHEYQAEKTDWVTTVIDLDIYAGTYKGDPSKDGTVIIRTTKILDEKALQKYVDKLGLATSYVITNEHGPLIDIPKKYQEEDTYEIINGEFILRSPGTTIDNTKVTRQ